MKPRNDFERELQGYIDRGLISPITPKQVTQAVKLMEQEKRYKVFVMNTEQRINGMELTKCYKVRRIGRGFQYIMFQLCLIKAQRGDETAWAARQCNIGVVASFSHTGNITIKGGNWWYDNYIKDRDTLRSVGKANDYAVTISRDHNEHVFMDSRIETLAKSNDAISHELVEHVISTEKALPDHVWSAYKVAKRHGYNFQGEMWRWIAYVDLLKQNGRDYHNPLVICPDNLFEAYQDLIDVNDRRLQRMRREREAMEEERRIKAAIAEKENYVKEHKQWLGIVIVGNGITIKPLQSIEEFKEEGDAMHHCVYSMGYYRYKNVLILSARDENGNRIATIEYNLEKESIVQCRAQCNKQPKRYKEIMSLVNGYEQLHNLKYAS